MVVFNCPAPSLGDDDILKIASLIEEQVRVQPYMRCVFEKQEALDAIAAFVDSVPHLDFKLNLKCVSRSDRMCYAALSVVERGAKAPIIFEYIGGEIVPMAEESQDATYLVQLFEDFEEAGREARWGHADLVASIIRKRLLLATGPFTALLFERAGRFRVLCQIVRDRHQAQLPTAASAMVYSRKRTFETWVDLLPTLQPAFDSSFTTWPELSSDIKRLLDFHSDGSLVLEGDRVALAAGKRPSLITMLWMAAYLVRQADHYLTVSDTSAAIACTTRVLETYTTFRLYEFGLLEVVNGADLDQTPQGQQRFAAMRQHGTGIRAALHVLQTFPQFSAIPIARMIEVNKLRNNSNFAHGVQRIPVSYANDALTDVKSYISQLENATAAVGLRWRNLLKASFLMDLKDVCSNTFRPLL